MLYTDETALVVALRDGDERAFVAVVEAYGPAMRRVARRKETDGLEPERFVQFVGRAQVPEVDRVEHPAENAERAHVLFRQLRGIATGSRAPDSAATRPVSVVQASPVVFDREATLAMVHALAGEAARKGARLVVFPEAFVSAYPRGLDFGAVVVHIFTPPERDYYSLEKHWSEAKTILRVQ